MNILSTIIATIITIVLLPFRIIFWIFLFLRANFGSNRVSIQDWESNENINYKDGVLSVNSDTMDIEEVTSLKRVFLSEGDFTEYKDTVKHAYTLDFVDNKEVCPRCNAATEQRIANFVYDGGSEIRVMYIPAGYFCLHCPTVIVDIDLIKEGVAQNFRFERLIGIDHEDNDDIDFFSTLNGEAVIFRSEDGQSVFIPELFDIEIQDHGLQNRSSKRKKKHKRKLQKSSRKKNRSKK